MERVRIISLEHGPGEGPGRMEDWAQERGHEFHSVPVYSGAKLPPLASFDLLWVLGGAMNVYEHRNHPWLPREKEFLAQAIAVEKGILGICLGAQLLADVLGGKVFQNPEKEVGWFPVEFTKRAGLFSQFPAVLTVMHWHGDTYSLPPGAENLAHSAGCANQAFCAGERVVGLQFHPEMRASTVAEQTAACASELDPARYVQTHAQIVAAAPDEEPIRAALFSLLDALVAKLKS